MTVVTKNKGKRKLNFDEGRLLSFVDNILKDFSNLKQKEIAHYKSKFLKSILSLKEIRAAEITNKLILEALNNVSREQPDWTYVASRIYLAKLYKEAAYNRSYDSSEKYGSLIGLLKTLGEKGIYSETILREYTKEEIKLAESFIDPTKDYLYTYAGLKTLSDRYLAKDHNKRTFELPQERKIIMALVLNSKEQKSKRMDYVKEAYWALSNQYMTAATPTWSNAGKSYGQLSSCFIDTVDDSLQSIYDSNTDIANLSKNGGGIGVYMGKVRSRGSDIRGFKGISSGVINWMKQLNNTAVAVDQLGTRQGSIAVYLDVWHKDINIFLEAKLNNGDERLRTHDLFLGACVPDLFMEQVEKRGDWYLFDPHEVKKVMGYSLEDCYDEKRGDGTFRERYEECIQNNDLTKTKVAAIDIMKSIMKAQLETGTLFMFYRDEVNRKNPNKHAGMIYSTNLCVEITQNMSATILTEQKLLDDGTIISYKKAGDFVTCNLSSIHLGNAYKDDVFERLIPIQMRLLDNVIDNNSIPVLQAQKTNERYRSVGLGTFSYHHLLALKGFFWGSDEAIKYTDHLYEKINYLAIKASMELAKEKGAYPLFKGSDWDNGDYFKLREYGTGAYDDTDRFIKNEQWTALAEEVHDYGMRNANIMAVAPNGTTSTLANGTASIDPVFNQMYFEEKKDSKIPVTVPDLSPKTMIYYENAYTVSQLASVKQNAARQRHIDQSQSFNIYVMNDIKAKDLLEIQMTAWDLGVKTTYYIRSTSIDILDCEVCQ
ncbi:ribonucleoside-diphosphate reductase subunit alpha [Solibacillus sp. FSL H8-0523]|uniref:ribonucleoside-diphosphate reductase subunit alpha n=1 Tax=Solibacillus sp. FSL H8-0523 TaxID=2954511 RepID=UPI003101A0DB